MPDAKNTITLISPYGGKLVNLSAKKEERDALFKKAKFLPSVQLSPRSLHDLQLLAVGAFSPLDRFMGEKDYLSVLKEMRLANGILFPIPITLPVENARNLEIGHEIALRGLTNEILAIMQLEEIYEWRLEEKAIAVLGTKDTRHPLVAEMQTWGGFHLSGKITVLNMQRYYDFPEMRKTPAEIRRLLEGMGCRNVVAYQPRHPMHRVHEEFTKRIIEDVNGTLLINPVVTNMQSGETDYYTRIRCYKALLERHYCPQDRVILNLLPLAPRMAGPRAGLWHGIINRNYGANHFIVGRDRAGYNGKTFNGEYSYESQDVQNLFKKHEQELGVQMIPFKEMVYIPEEQIYDEPSKVISRNRQFIKIWESGLIEESFTNGKRLPEWFTRPEVSHILHEVNPPRAKQGFCIWLTGTPSSGKSTIADILAPMLMAKGRKITLLDGDVTRTHLSKGLGFGKDDRILNIIRIGFVASEIVRHNGAVICALISPYTSARDKVRSMIGSDKFIEVFVDTPIDVCKERDVKGMYALAKEGAIKSFTGVDDVYEPPLYPEIRINTIENTPMESALKIINYLKEKSFLSKDGSFEAIKNMEANLFEHF
jgi:sulfate adenylyltransferase